MWFCGFSCTDGKGREPIWTRTEEEIRSTPKDPINLICFLPQRVFSFFSFGVRVLFWGTDLVELLQNQVQRGSRAPWWQGRSICPSPSMNPPTAPRCFGSTRRASSRSQCPGSDLLPLWGLWGLEPFLRAKPDLAAIFWARPRFGICLQGPYSERSFGFATPSPPSPTHAHLGKEAWRTKRSATSRWEHCHV